MFVGLARRSNAFVQVRTGLSSLKNLQKRRKEEADQDTEDISKGGLTSKSSDPWMYRMLDEETLGINRSYELSLAHKLEFQRLYVPDLKLPYQDESMKIGCQPLRKEIIMNKPIPDVTKYTPQARKFMKKEIDWARDSVREQLTNDNLKTRQDLTNSLREAFPVPDLDWNCQFPMWNPRRHKLPAPRKGRIMYMYAQAKGEAYVFKKSKPNIYHQNISFRGLA
eukprot:TRINITY_DN7703_c0_g1_i1.p1 TRINITY_DN7703_c0_g1~~TRINITY_DN7703_c0_g1_i1.p1  ORF type:complete len:223 (+),score=17.26 TRINITY_DN7703_c0_g1_i1:52-720(+)